MSLYELYEWVVHLLGVLGLLVYLLSVGVFGPERTVMMVVAGMGPRRFGWLLAFLVLMMLIAQVQWMLARLGAH